MTSDIPLNDLMHSIDQSSHRRETDMAVRAVEAAARREAIEQQRSTTRSTISNARGHLQALEDQRRFRRQRIRDEMRAQLLNLNADVEQLRRRVRKSLADLKNDAARLTAAGRQRVAELRAEVGHETTQRRQDTRRLLQELQRARAANVSRTQERLEGYCEALRQSTANTLSAYRAERARHRVAWQARRKRRSEAALPVTMVDVQQGPPAALASLIGGQIGPEVGSQTGNEAPSTMAAATPVPRSDAVGQSPARRAGETAPDVPRSSGGGGAHDPDQAG